MPSFPLDTLVYTPPSSAAEGTVSVSVVCDNGGTISLDETRTGTVQTATTQSSEFDNCQTDTAVLDGDFVSRDFGNLILTATDFEIVEGLTSSSFFSKMDYQLKGESTASSVY